MEITVEQVAMIRENYNPKSVELSLDVDWSVEFRNTDQREVNYEIILKASNNFNFKLVGTVKLEYYEEFLQNEYSQVIFHHAFEMFMDLVSLTRQSKYELLNENSTVTLNTAF